MLICLCGKIGSGKTTCTNILKEKYNAISFNVDDWMVNLFGEHLSREEHDEKREKCIQIICGITRQLLDKGLNVILDFGFWTKRQRKEIRNQFKEYPFKMVYLPLSDEEQMRRVKIRNESSNKTYTFTEEMLETLNSFFEEPDNTEDFEIM